MDKKDRDIQIKKDIFTGLTSKDSKKMMDAVKKLKDKGDETYIEPLMEMYLITENDELRSELRKVLSTLKSSKATDIFINQLSDEDEKNELIFFCLWHANLDASMYLPQIVEACCKSSYLTAIEALTLIDNLPGPFSDDMIKEALTILDQQNLDESDEKYAIMESIKDIIQSLVS